MALGTSTRTRRTVRRAFAPLMALALVSALGACTSSSAPGATPAPALSPSSLATSSTPSAGATGTTTTARATTAPAATATATTGGGARPTPSESTPVAVQGTCERTLPAYPVIAPGARGAAVRALQCFLNDADYGPVLVDGVYGPQTRAAVTRVEAGFEGPAPQPGRIDSGMWVLIISRSMGNQPLRQGDTGADVTTLQRALRAAGGRIAVDGVFGPQTTAVVKQFQQANRVPVDGVVGEQTYFFLKGGGVIGRG